MLNVYCQSQIFEEIKLFGIQIVIDDFGIGYFLMVYFCCLFLDCLKVDWVFIRDLIEQLNDCVIVVVMVVLVYSLDLQVIVEGVEIIVQCDMFCEFEVDEL